MDKLAKQSHGTKNLDLKVGRIRSVHIFPQTAMLLAQRHTVLTVFANQIAQSCKPEEVTMLRMANGANQNQTT